MYFAGSLVSWRSKLGHIICLSSAQAEYVAATECTKEVVWLRELLKEIGHGLAPTGPTELREDNLAVIKIATNEGVSDRNKHMGIKLAYLRQNYLELQTITFSYCNTKFQVADILTKNLPKPAFLFFRSFLLGQAAIPEKLTTAGIDASAN